MARSLSIWIVFETGEHVPTAAFTVTEELREYLFETVSNSCDLRGCRWVMNIEWLLECRKISDPMGHPLWAPSLNPGLPESFLGFPVVIRSDAGAPRLMASCLA